LTAPRRSLGTTGVPIAPIGLGCMGMSDFYGPRDDAASVALIHHALDVGVNLFDTADMYGPWTNERLVGGALRERRDEAVIATKFGVMRDASGGWLGINGRPEYVHQACDASLERLGVDTIDLYYQHRVDKSVPIEETVGAMAELVRAGKVRALGLSEATADELRRAHAVHPIAALQMSSRCGPASRRRRSCRCARSSASRSSRIRRSAAGSSPAASRRRATSRLVTSGATTPGSPATTSSGTSISSRPSARSPRARA
jgi:diketogulonate reductase-like aldo/keto reductase